ncbi:MAG: ferredoxin FdxA [Litoreibacter sp.]
MTYVVTDACINCKYQDCIEVCPVDCFYEGENTVVINTEDCIDCGVCEPECPVEAIIPDTEPAAEQWISLNQKYAEMWPQIVEKGVPPADADAWAGKEGKLALLSENPGAA